MMPYLTSKRKSYETSNIKEGVANHLYIAEQQKVVLRLAKFLYFHISPQKCSMVPGGITSNISEDLSPISSGELWFRAAPARVGCSPAGVAM